MLTLHLIDWASGAFDYDGEKGRERPTVPDVSERTARNAIALIEKFFRPTWERATGTFSERPVDKGAQKIAEYIKRKKLTQITRRDITQAGKGWRDLRGSEAIDKALHVLVEHAFLDEPLEAPKGAKGGRPSAIYHVNPKVHLNS
jgi:hypothetical protein